MEIQVDGVKIGELLPWQLEVIANDIPTEELPQDIKRRILWAPIHKFEQCYARIEKEWIPKLRAAGVSSIPTDQAQFWALVKARPEYQNRSQRDAAAKAMMEPK